MGGNPGIPGGSNEWGSPTDPQTRRGESRGGTVGVVLAAGHGKRMRSDLLKVLHPVGGVPMVALVLDALREAGVGRVIAVVGHQREAVRQLLGDRVEYAVQERQLGTGHALLQARPLIDDGADAVVLYGDTPLLTPETLARLIRVHREREAAATLLTVTVEDPRGYGRIVRDAAGRFERIVEEADAGPAEKAIREVNPGIYCFRAGPLFAALERVRPDNAQGEYYLVDVIPDLLAGGFRVETVLTEEPLEVQGVNTRRDLARAEAALRERVLNRLMDSGVTVVDPATTYVSPRARVGRDTVLAPFTVIEGETEVGRGCRLGPGAHITGCRLGDGVRVWHSVLEESQVADGVTIGPFSHLRAGSRLEPGVQVGNFAEVKNSHLGAGTKVHHHSYIGDAVIGSRVNIGAGVVTVNYDGVAKHPTHIGDGAFIGCNANLVAPVRVADGGYVAAGSTINQDVPPGALAIARARQENKQGWVEKRFNGKHGGNDR